MQVQGSEAGEKAIFFLRPRDHDLFIHLVSESQISFFNSPSYTWFVKYWRQMLLEVDARGRRNLCNSYIVLLIRKRQVVVSRSEGGGYLTYNNRATVIV